MVTRLMNCHPSNRPIAIGGLFLLHQLCQEGEQLLLLSLHIFHHPVSFRPVTGLLRVVLLFSRTETTRDEVLQRDGLSLVTEVMKCHLETSVNVAVASILFFSVALRNGPFYLLPLLLLPSPVLKSPTPPYSLPQFSAMFPPPEEARTTFLLSEAQEIVSKVRSLLPRRDVTSALLKLLRTIASDGVLVSPLIITLYNGCPDIPGHSHKYL